MTTVSKVMAHRGGRYGGPPNSIDAIAHARSVGASCVEIDVNETSDGVTVATHDAIVGDLGWITEQTYVDLLDHNPEEWASRRLDEVVEFTLATSTVAYLDLKSTTPKGLQRIVDTWPDDVEAHRIVFASARGDIIAWIGRHLPTAGTSLLYYDPMLDLRSLGGFVTPTYLHPCFDFVREPFHTLNEQYVERARALGHGLVSWSENDPERIARLGELGFDFVCTDEPELACGVLTVRD